MLFANTKGESIGAKASEVIGLIVVAIIYVYLIPTFVSAVTGIDTSGWNFTGSTGAVAILFLLPFVFIVGLVLWFVKSILD
jgi:hypothetical protein